MFDDVQPKKIGSVPQDLPTVSALPDDMFAEAGEVLEPVESAPLTNVPPTRLSTSAVDAGLLRPKNSESAPMQVLPTQAPFSDVPDRGADDEMNRIKPPSVGRGILIAVIMAVALVIVGGGGWWIYAKYVRTEGAEVFPAQTAVDNTMPTTPEPPAVTRPANDDTSAATDISTTLIDDAALFGEPVDSDSDGLDDLREQELGTDPLKWDTDGDALGDRDEVISWKTNPLNKDTDGDKFEDGNEVKAGYNPLGPGKYTVVPTSTVQ